MVGTEPVDVVFKRIEARRGDVAGLAHSAAHQLAQPVRPADVFATAEEERAGRRAEAFRQADRDGVENGAMILRSLASCHERVPQPRAIQVKGEAEVIAGGANPA